MTAPGGSTFFTLWRGSNRPAVALFSKDHPRSQRLLLLRAQVDCNLTVGLGSHMPALCDAYDGPDGRAPVVRAHPPTPPRAPPGFVRGCRELGAVRRLGGSGSTNAETLQGAGLGRRERGWSLEKSDLAGRFDPLQSTKKVEPPRCRTFLEAPPARSAPAFAPCVPSVRVRRKPECAECGGFSLLTGAVGGLGGEHASSFHV